MAFLEIASVTRLGKRRFRFNKGVFLIRGESEYEPVLPAHSMVSDAIPRDLLPGGDIPITE